MLADGSPLRHLAPSTFRPLAPPTSATYQSPTTPSKAGEGAPTGSASKVTVVSPVPASGAGAAAVALTAGTEEGGEGVGGALATVLVDEAAGGDGERSHAASMRAAVAEMNALSCFIA